MANKDEGFWKGLMRWDLMIFSETWVDSKGCNRIRSKLSRGYRWEVQWAERRNKKGIAMGESCWE